MEVGDDQLLQSLIRLLVAMLITTCIKIGYSVHATVHCGLHLAATREADVCHLNHVAADIVFYVEGFNLWYAVKHVQSVDVDLPQHLVKNEAKQYVWLQCVFIVWLLH